MISSLSGLWLRPICLSGCRGNSDRFFQVHGLLDGRPRSAPDIVLVYRVWFSARISDFDIFMNTIPFPYTVLLLTLVPSTNIL